MNSPENLGPNLGWGRKASRKIERKGFARKEKKTPGSVLSISFLSFLVDVSSEMVNAFQYAAIIAVIETKGENVRDE